MKKFLRWLFGILVLLASLFMLIKFIPEQHVSVNNENKKFYTLGAILPLTGDASMFGEVFSKVILLAEEEINNGDGTDGIKIKFIIEDGKCNGKDAANSTQKLAVVNKVQAILGGFCSSETLAATPIAESNKVVLLSAGSTSPDLSNMSPYFFRNIASDSSQARLIAESAIQKGYKILAVLQEQTDYAFGQFSVFNQHFAHEGRKILKEEYLNSVSDLRTSLLKLKSQNPEALFLITQTPNTAQKIFKQLKDLNWRPQLFINETIIGDSKTVSENKEILEGAVGVEPEVDESNEKFKHFMISYKQKYGQDMPYPSFGQNIYDAVYLLVDGIKQVGYNGENLAKWSRTINNWHGASGVINIDENGDRKSGYVLKIIKNGIVEFYIR